MFLLFVDGFCFASNWFSLSLVRAGAPVLTMAPQFPGLWKLYPQCLLDVRVHESFVVLDRKGVKGLAVGG